MDRPRTDRDLRDLLIYLRDTFHDAASRIDTYLESQENPRDFNRSRGDFNSRPPADAAPRGRFEQPRDSRGNDRNDRGNDRPRAQGFSQPPQGGHGPAVGTHFPLEKLREEVRWVSSEAGKLDPVVLRLHIEAITAETRSLQAQAEDPADLDIAAKIMRALTAIVSDHRPGHVYGLARHHQADWEDIARKARTELRSRGSVAPVGDARRDGGDELPEG